jgi:hypothetical protein
MGPNTSAPLVRGRDYTVIPATGAMVGWPQFSIRYRALTVGIVIADSPRYLPSAHTRAGSADAR